MPDEPIGSVRVDVVADYSKLSQGFQAAQGEAAKAGASIASSFTSAVGPTNTLTAAAERLKNAESAVASEGAKMLQQVQADSLGFASAQKQLAEMNAELTAAKLAYQSLAGSEAAATAATSAHTTAMAHQVSQLQATSGFIRTAEGNGGIRAAENFLAKTLGLGPAFQTLFPIVGAVAFLEILNKIIEAITETISRAVNARNAISDAWHDLQLSSKTANDELQLTSDKLANQIAILEGKPENTLLQALDQDRVMADRLAAALEGAVSQMQKLFQEQAVGAAGLLVGVAPTRDPGLSLPGAQDEMTLFKRKIASLDDQIREASGNKNAQKALIAERYQAYENEVQRHTDHLNEFITLQAERTKKIQKAISVAGQVGGTAAQLANPSQSANIGLEEGMIAQLKLQEQFAKTAQTVGSQTNQLAGLEAGKKAAEEQMRAWEEALNAKKATDEVSVTEERNYWRAILSSLTEGSSNYRAVLAKVGSLNQQVAKQWRQAEIHEVTADAKDFQDQLARVMASAEETTGMPKTAGLDFVRAKLEAATISQGAYEDALKKIPELERGAAKESEDVIRRWVKTSEDIFAEGGARTAAEVSANAAQMIAVLKQMGGAEDELAAQQKRKNAADKTVSAQTLRISRIDSGGAAASAETDAQARKIALESQYALQSFHTTQQQIAYAQQLSAYDEEIMRLKQGALEIDVLDALTAGDVVKANQAAAQWLHEDDAIRLHRLQTEAKIAEITHRASFGGQISAGLTKDAESAVSRLSSGIATLATQTKGWGQEFKNILKEVERSIVETFASSALKTGLNALLSASKPGGKSGGGQLGTEGGMAFLAALTANTAATSTDAAVTTTHTGIMSSHLGVMVSHLGAMISNTAAAIANTIVIIAQTLATWALAAVETIKAFFGFATGGNPDPNQPFIAGENGPELIHPKGRSLTVVTADKTRQMLAAAQQGIGNFQIPQGSLDIPQVAPSATISASRAHSISSSSASAVNNHNTGNIGTAHFNIYESRNPRQTVREIASYMKLSSPKFSPANS